MRKLRQTCKVEMGEESIKSVKSHMQKGATINAYICIQGRGGMKNWS